MRFSDTMEDPVRPPPLTYEGAICTTLLQQGWHRIAVSAAWMYGKSLLTYAASGIRMATARKRVHYESKSKYSTSREVLIY